VTISLRLEHPIPDRTPIPTGVHFGGKCNGGGLVRFVAGKVHPFERIGFDIVKKRRVTIAVDVLESTPSDHEHWL
jgi:hypothetical protein